MYRIGFKLNREDSSMDRAFPTRIYNNNVFK